MFNLPELQVIRASLDHVTIRGADAKLLANLQMKIEELLSEYEQVNNTESDSKTTTKK